MQYIKLTFREKINRILTLIGAWILFYFVFLFILILRPEIIINPMPQATDLHKGLVLGFNLILLSLLNIILVLNIIATLFLIIELFIGKPIWICT